MKIADSIIIVVAAAHLKRKPAYWKGRNKPKREGQGDILKFLHSVTLDRELTTPDQGF
jgi:hypothetical protein